MACTARARSGVGAGVGADLRLPMELLQALTALLARTIGCRRAKGLHTVERRHYASQGAQLEPALGSARFARLLVELLLTSQALAVLLARVGASAAPALLGSQYTQSCAVGFSCVLFALKARVISTLDTDI